MQADSNDEEMTDTWKFVALGNQNALLTAIRGDPAGALAELDSVRDAGIAVEISHPELQNEIECRRLESRLQVSAVTNDSKLLWKTMREIGQSNRFSAPRLHEMMGVASGIVREMLGKKPQ
jgi:hypothetical protein